MLHIPAYSESHLPAILSKAGSIEAIHPEDGALIEPRKIYVAPNDHHLLIEGNHVLVKKGPKENRFRPSIDALFRSAAYNYGSRVIGIVLSGLLNDGTSGLWTVKRHGGIAIIQDPEDAVQPQMPENALEYVEPDYIVAARDMGALISGIVNITAPERFKFSEEELKRLKMEVVIAEGGDAFGMGIMSMGEFTPFTCPDCHGALVRLEEGNLIRFRCHTGHAYTASSLLSEVTESVERMLIQSMRGMEEMTMLLRTISTNFKKLNNTEAADLFQKKAEDAKSSGLSICEAVLRQQQYSEDLRLAYKISPTA